MTSWLAAAVALVGALVLLRPTPDSFQPAALLALAAAVVYAELTYEQPPKTIGVLNYENKSDL